MRYDKLYRDSGELVGGHIDLGDDDGVVVLEVLAQLVPDGSQLLAVATPALLSEYHGA